MTYLDRLNQPLSIGCIVKVVEHFETNPDDRWIIHSFNEWRTVTEAVLENVDTKQIKWIPLWDLEKL